MKTLPYIGPDAIAIMILEDIKEIEDCWDESLVKSQNILAELVPAAMTEYHAGKTHHLEPEAL